MPIHFNRTIAPARDARLSAQFLADLLGLPAPTRFGPFYCVALENGVTLDFMDTAGDVEARHFAFLVSETVFDAIFGRIRDRGLPYWADPFHRQPGQINRHDGGRGVYWDDRDGDDWRSHFGPAFERLRDAKRKFDPGQELVPGYEVF